MTELEKILDGETRISDYNIDWDFDNDEIGELLEHDIIKATDIGISRASDLLIDGIIDYDDYPFEDFSAYEQIRQLQYCAIEPGDFLRKADLESFNADEWLFLLDVLPRMAESAPWERLCSEGSVKGWMDLLRSRREFDQRCPWEKLGREGKEKDFFSLLRVRPDLYCRLPNRKELLEADSALWTDLLSARPELAQYYPLETLDEVDEVEHLLLHQPSLVNRIHWDKENPPVKLYIRNPKAEILEGLSCNIDWYISSEISNDLAPILGKVLFYTPEDAKRYANIIGHNTETFAGIYSYRTAEHILERFVKESAEKKLELFIRKEEVDNHGN